MKRAFCTIITSNYLPFAQALFNSIKKFDSNVNCFALILNSNSCFNCNEFESLRLTDLSE